MNSIILSKEATEPIGSKSLRNAGALAPFAEGRKGDTSEHSPLLLL